MAGINGYAIARGLSVASEKLCPQYIVAEALPAYI